MRTITRIAIATFAALGIALGALGVAVPDMHYHAPPSAGAKMHYHG